MSSPIHHPQFAMNFHDPDPVFGTWARPFDLWLDRDRYHDFARTAARPTFRRRRPVPRGWPRLPEVARGPEMDEDYESPPG